MQKRDNFNEISQESTAWLEKMRQWQFQRNSGIFDFHMPDHRNPGVGNRFADVGQLRVI